MSYSLKGQIALVTGGTKGIGKAIADKLHSTGATVIVTARTAPEENPNGYYFVGADIAKPESADNIAKEVLEKFGKIDILINNAGANLSMGGSFSTLTEEHWHNEFELNLMAAVRMNKAFLPGMIAQKSGSIVNISTIASRQPIWELTMTYSAAKAALNAYSKALAAEVGSKGIRVNAVSPGIIKTPLMEDFLTGIAESANITVGEAFKNVMSRSGEVPLGRMGEPEEIANLVAFLVSPEATFIAGANYLIDGGLSAAI
ncbi:NAD(P)-dependent dehydrogenase, short-chain alcohol dehydrogenase family [Chitinophaga jiangningensis]|uniref:NAD(P)-dependent dehydrogenase, short-chain alcohol dehydrogenase family n=1 Tax=Chitinophaga jiangningensis TaxID=1419482 RepID=A0A1M7M7U9_9BACT|nr:SDR family oxidoreductase [Chitinophaga jiangningensis]SHM86814.1 NAD(P)-dependent dehydrogenase, short-chain alcohol dehydrogenase family [Chitinophaga jiangningensis]